MKLNRDILCDLGYEDSIGFENPDYDEAVDFIDYNTIRSLPYAGEGAPIVMYKIGECE